MKLDVYSGKDIQMFMALLNTCESAGVSDIRFIRQQLQLALDSRMGALKQPYSGRPKRESIRQQPVCPQCGSNRWRPNQDTNGEIYVLCKDCQYSELLGDK